MELQITLENLLTGKQMIDQIDKSQTDILKGFFKKYIIGLSKYVNVYFIMEGEFESLLWKKRYIIIEQRKSRTVWVD